MGTHLFNSIIFGPIHSRRLGTSLGINLLPAQGKVCNFDCIYCECGSNAERKGGKLPSAEEVIAALEVALREMHTTNKTLDVITFAGNGEPTLHPQFALVVAAAMKLRDQYFPTAKVSVLSNGTMAGNPSVKEALLQVDNNILKLDTAVSETFLRINQPKAQLDLEQIMLDLEDYKGAFILQTLFLRGIVNEKIIDNTTSEEVSAWIKAVLRIAPKEVMLYSLDRPTPQQHLEKVNTEEIASIAAQLKAAGYKGQIVYT